MLVVKGQNDPLVPATTIEASYKDQKPTSVQVFLHRERDWYVEIQLKDYAPDPLDSDGAIGVNFGRRDIATVDTGRSWCGKAIQSRTDKLSRLRASL